MSFFRRAASTFLERRGADQRLPWGDSTPPPPSLVGANASGIPVTQGVAAGIAAVYGCCGFIADSVASLPIELRNGPDRKDSSKLPLSPLLTKPYAEISRRDWWIQFIWALALRGNFYGRVVERDDRYQPVQIKPIHNDAVQIWRDRGSGQLVYRFYGEKVPPQDVVHARYQTQPGEIVGLNPIQLLALTFGNAVAKERFVESYYLNSATPMGVIQVPGYLDRGETRKMMRGWLAAHQGLNNANLPAILTGDAEFKPITISPSDSQLIEALQFSESQICGRVFRVPPHAIGIVDRTTSWGRGIEQQERGFFANTLVGYLQIGCELLTGYHRTGQFVHFDTTKRERGATLERAQAGALLMNSGVARADEVRDWFDWAELPDDEGKQSFMPINTQLLEMALATLGQDEESPGGSTDSGAPPNGSVPRLPGSKPPRKNAPAASPRSYAQNGYMTPEEAEWIVRESLPPALATRVLRRSEVRPPPIEMHLHLDQPISVAQGEPRTEVNVAPARAPEVRFSPLIEVAGPEINVPTPEVRVAAPEVYVAAPEVHVDSPSVQVDVAAPDVRVEVPQAAAPEVRVEAPSVEVLVPTPEVNVTTPSVQVEVPVPEVRVEVPQVAAPDVRVEVAAPEVNVSPHFEAPPAPDVRVDVAAPNVTIEPHEINVEAPSVRVEAPSVRVEPPEVNVAAPTVNVAAPSVNVEPPEVNVEAPTVNVGPPEVNVAAPNVSVAAPSVHVDAPQVSVEPRFEAPRAPNVTVKPQIHLPEPQAEAPEARKGRHSKRVERDDRGRITRIVEEEE